MTDTKTLISISDAIYARPSHRNDAKCNTDIALVFISGLLGYDEYPSAVAVFHNRQSANSFLVHKRFSPQGIVCECCANHCDKNEFGEYCAPTSQRRKRSILKKLNQAAGTEERDSMAESSTTTAPDEELVETFYREIDSIAQSDAPIPDVNLYEFSNMPLIRQLEQQKRMNIHRTPDRRSSEEIHKGADNYRSKYDSLKKYFKQRLTEMLLVVDSDSTQADEMQHQKPKNASSTKSGMPSAKDLHALMGLFKSEDMMNKSR